MKKLLLIIALSFVGFSNAESLYKDGWTPEKVNEAVVGCKYIVASQYDTSDKANDLRRICELTSVEVAKTIAFSDLYIPSGGGQDTRDNRTNRS